jgi:hypothetical protein
MDGNQFKKCLFTILSLIEIQSMTIDSCQKIEILELTILHIKEITTIQRIMDKD